MASSNSTDSKEAECGFAEELAEITRMTATGMAIVIGTRLGLIKDLSERESPANIRDIAKSTNLKERYVREWCSVMATGGILEVRPDGENYFLPVRKRKVLLGDDARAMQALFMLNSLPSYVGSDHMKRFTSVMKADGPPGLAFEPETASEEGMYTLSINLEIQQLTLMLNADPTLKPLLESGLRVLELGCNAGMLSLELACHYPSSTFCGVDIDSKAIIQAKEGARNSNNSTFHVQDITDLPTDWSEKFDYIFAFKVIHDVSKPRDALKQAWNVLKTGGKFSLFEYNLSSNCAENMHNKLSPAIYLGSLMYCIPYSIGLDNGESLGAAWGVAKMKSYLVEAGFKNIQVVDPNSYPLVHVIGYK